MTTSIPKLTDEEIGAAVIHFDGHVSDMDRQFSRAIESTVRAPLERRIAELEEALESMLWAEDKQPDHWPNAIRHARATLQPANQTKD